MRHVNCALTQSLSTRACIDLWRTRINYVTDHPLFTDHLFSPIILFRSGGAHSRGRSRICVPNSCSVTV